MENDTKKTQGETQASVDEGRRRLGKAALVATPVLYSLTGRSAWARNCTLSGQLSGNLSDQGPDCGGEGCSSDFWRNHTGQWHHLLQPHQMFVDVFGVDAFPGKSLHDVVRLSDPTLPYDMGHHQMSMACVFGSDAERNHYQNTLRQLGYQSVAALQNAATAVSYALSVEEVIKTFANAYGSCNVIMMEDAKNSLGTLNSLFCPLN